MLGKEFEAAIRNGQKPVVIFLKSVEDLEGYLEPGMRGRIVAVRDEDDDLLSFTVDLAEFETFNAAFESSNYYDKDGNPRLTAREAGYYKPIEEIWSGRSDEVPMSLEDSGRLNLFTAYQDAKVGLSYVQWLEDLVLAQKGFGTQGEAEVTA